MVILSLGSMDSARAQEVMSPKERQAFNEKFFEAQALKAKGDLEEAGEIFQELYNMNSTNAVVNFELAQIYADANDEESAVFHGERAAELNDTNRWYTYLLANVYGQFGRSQKQISVYEKLVDKEPRNVQYRVQLAQAYMGNDESEKALEQLDALEEQMGINEGIIDLKKNIYLAEGELEKAAAELKRLVEAYPATMDYYGSLAQLYSANDLEEKAFEVYQQMLAVDSTDPRPHLDLANYYRSREEFSKSLHHLKYAMQSDLLDIEKKIPVLLSLFKASAGDSSLRQEAYSMMDHILESDAEDPRIYAMYGDYLSRDGKDRKAITYYKKALDKKGGQKFQIWEQVLLLEVQNEMYDSLAKDAPAAVESFPNQPLPYFFAGLGLNAQEKHEDALYYLEDGLNYVLGNPALKEQFYVQLADVHHRLKNHKESDEYFEKALALNDQNATSLNNYAYYLSVRGEKLDRALELTEKSNRLSPDNPVFLDTWAWVHYQRGEYEAALDKIQRVFELAPDQSGEVLEHYGDILMKLDRKSEALEKYHQARKSGYSSKSLQSKIDALQ